ncbi:MAG: protein TolR [Magnetococcales bacterium]|nr:protein TolR [Magnetococcales bacterium]MBF0322550.1 protein TolR [Magnetococcales bacterium]
MGMGSSMGSGRHGPMSDINVTPMVDIMLVLLIIFMVAAPLLSQGVEVELPNAQANPMSSEQEPLVVTVTAGGVPSIEGKTVNMDQLSVRIRAVKLANPRLPIYVRGDQRANYGDIMRVMAEIQQAGATEIGLMTEPR